jgi:large subunit ribosomal protein L18
MAKQPHKLLLLERRKRRIRRKIHGSPERPRLAVRRSLKHIYAQLVDDLHGRTIAEASSVSLKIPGAGVEAAKKVGKAIAQRAIEKNVKAVRFDRAGRLYHGRVKALADAAREAGLEF